MRPSSSSSFSAYAGAAGVAWQRGWQKGQHIAQGTHYPKGRGQGVGKGSVHEQEVGDVRDQVGDNRRVEIDMQVGADLPDNGLLAHGGRVKENFLFRFGVVKRVGG